MENIINEGKQIQIDGKDYIIRRLNTRDVFKVAAILSKVYRPGVKYTEGQESNFAATLLSAMPLAENDLVSLLASVINVSVSEFDELPPEAIFDVIEGLAESQDLQRFFNRVKEVMSKMKLGQ